MNPLGNLVWVRDPILQKWICATVVHVYGLVDTGTVDHVRLRLPGGSELTARFDMVQSSPPDEVIREVLTT